MFRFCVPALALVVLIQLADTAEACIPPPPPLRLPNESNEAYKVRSEAVFRALSDEDRRRYQVTLYERSDRVFLGLVESSETIDAAGLPGHRVIVRPVAALKGDLPGDRMTLADRYMTTCGPAGGGSATAAQPDDYIVVLEGNLFHKGSEAFGLRMNELREPRILKSLDDVAQKSSAASVNRYSRR